jgi:hypothetical protein
MYHGADRATLLVICREGFDTSACRDGRVYFSNSRYTVYVKHLAPSGPLASFIQDSFLSTFSEYCSACHGVTLFFVGESMGF